MTAAFCDYCKCEVCKNGTSYLKHAPVVGGGGWICDVCFMYDLCTSGPNRNKDGPCENEDCVHRPRLSGPWRGLSVSQ